MSVILFFNMINALCSVVYSELKVPVYSELERIKRTSNLGICIHGTIGPKHQCNILLISN